MSITLCLRDRNSRNRVNKGGQVKKKKAATETKLAFRPPRYTKAFQQEYDTLPEYAGTTSETSGEKFKLVVGKAPIDEKVSVGEKAEKDPKSKDHDYDDDMDAYWKKVRPSLVDKFFVENPEAEFQFAAAILIKETDEEAALKTCDGFNGFISEAEYRVLSNAGFLD